MQLDGDNLDPSVTVVWENLLATAEAWIALDEIVAHPVQKMENYPNQAWCRLSDARGYKTFSGVVPGSYKARYYLVDQPDSISDAFKQSDTTINVPGLGLEYPTGTYDKAPRRIQHYYFKKTPNGPQFARPIVLRWYFDPNDDRWKEGIAAWEKAGRPANRQAYFWITVSGEGATFEEVKAKRGGKYRPFKYFGDITNATDPTSWNHGRWALDETFRAELAATPGDWELRACFKDPGGTTVSVTPIKIEEWK